MVLQSTYSLLVMQHAPTRISLLSQQVSVHLELMFFCLLGHILQLGSNQS